MPEPRFAEIVILCPVELEDIVTAQLWTQGIEGCEIREAAEKGRGWLEIRAFFRNSSRPVPSIPSWLGERVVLCSVGPVEDRDWLEVFRETSEPIEVGERFTVDPGPARSYLVKDPLSASSRIVLSIPAERAFGTGSHESTRLAVEWLEELDLRNRTMLDVGTGSGILLVVGFHLGARAGLGFDVDPLAVIIASSNIRRNTLASSCRPRVFAGRLAALDSGSGFDVVVANILPQRIRTELVRLREYVTGGGELICSGHLAVDRARAETDFSAAGLGVVGSKQDGEWIAYRLRADG